MAGRIEARLQELGITLPAPALAWMALYTLVFALGAALAGFAASQGQMNLLGAILWTTVGSVVGALALYVIGALLGRDRTRSIASATSCAPSARCAAARCSARKRSSITSIAAERRCHSPRPPRSSGRTARPRRP